jgi:hypothetical protein
VSWSRSSELLPPLWLLPSLLLLLLLGWIFCLASACWQDCLLVVSDAMFNRCSCTDLGAHPSTC